MQKEIAITSRPTGIRHSFIVTPAYKCKTFFNTGNTDNFTVDYSLKGFGDKLQACKKCRSSIMHVLVYLSLTHSVWD